MKALGEIGGIAEAKRERNHVGEGHIIPSSVFQPLQKKSTKKKTAFNAVSKKMRQLRVQTVNHHVNPAGGFTSAS